ncbi:putative DNA repair protein [Tenacibaculum maritimum]|uniref:JAB domain-containing protein n=1 Tax=Tenacibaculum maritimum TaxID=107401 RepID=UPI0012E519E4|nr:JAB domain-containing protein [Tenacibaculum maritimum]CAA0163373.1 putative DNA repair protein [Tenacibaculum maritimum]CAA0173315.1 putative DNA repair protein [Tenacibaculum maritimum]
MNIAEVKVSYTTNNAEKLRVTNSKTSYDVLLACWNKNTLELQEEFKVLLLNRNNQVLGIYPLSKGGTTSSIVDVKLLFSVALKCNAHGIILAHNHPSGNFNPSTPDKNITTKIINASKLLDLKILDHIIVSKQSYYSFADNNLM